jgi:hypothetical protein
MKNTLHFISLIVVLIIFSGCNINKNSASKKTNNQLVSQNETLRNENKQLKQQLKDKTEELNHLKTEMQNPKTKGNYPSEIDELLNIEDTTIFTSNFKQYELNSVHPRSRKMYQWVSSIHGLGEQLKLIEKDHQTIEIYNKDITDLPPQTVEQLKSLNTAIKDNIRLADKLRQDIEVSYSEMKIAFTSAQMAYYNHLVDKLNNFINIYFE